MSVSISPMRREAFHRGRRLADLRCRLGLTQADVAAAMGVSQARVSKIEAGSVFGVDVVRAYVRALGGDLRVLATFPDGTWDLSR